MKNLIILCCLFSIIVSGCKKNSETPNNVVLDRFVSIAYLNANENNSDLLDPSNPNAIKADDIEIFYLENGEKHRVYNANFDLPKNFKIGKAPNNEYYHLSVAVSTSLDKNNIGTTYIQVNKYNFTDTLTTTIYKSEDGNATRVSKVWYNGVFKVNGMETSPMFTIVK